MQNFKNKMSVSSRSKEISQWFSVNGVKYDENGPDAHVCDTIKAVKNNKDLGEGVLAAMFLHPCLRSGSLIHELCLGLESSDLENLLKENADLARLFFNTVVPVTSTAHTSYSVEMVGQNIHKVQSQLKSLYSFNYALKLALQLRPNDTKLHDMMLDRMDFTKFGPI